MFENHEHQLVSLHSGGVYFRLRQSTFAKVTKDKEGDRSGIAGAGVSQKDLQ